MSVDDAPKPMTADDEVAQPPVDDRETEDSPKGEEGAEFEAEGSASTPPSEAGSAARADAKAEKSSERSSTLLIQYLLRGGKPDPEMKALFMKAMKEKHGEKAKSEEAWAEVEKLIDILPELLGNLNERLTALAAKKIITESKSGEPRELHFTLAHEKMDSIVQALCTTVLNGHIAAADIRECLSSISLMSREEMEKDGITSAGYEGLLFYDLRRNRIIIPETSLADNYHQHKDGSEGNDLDLTHLINHELSHALVRNGLTNAKDREAMNKGAKGEPAEHRSPAFAKACEIINKAEEFAPFQSQHIKLVLEGIKHTEAAVAKETAPDNKTKLQAQLAKQKMRAAEEILTDYTAIYLQSNGSKENFLLQCVDKADRTSLASFLATDLTAQNGAAETITAQNAVTIAKREMVKVNTLLIEGNKTQDEQQQVLAKYPSLVKMYQCYMSFYRFLNDPSDGIPGKKGQFKKPESFEGDLYDDGYIPETPEAYAQNQQDQGSNKQQGDSLVAEAAAGLAAFGDAMNFFAPITG